MPSKPEISQPDSIRGDVTLDPFQLDSLRPLLEEHELQIKAHFDEKMEQLSRMLSHSFGILVGSGGRARPDFDDLPVHRVASSGPSGRRTSTGGALSVSLGPEAELGLKAGVAPHLVQLIERVKASHEVKAPIFSSTRSLSRRNAVELCRSFMGLYEYLVDFMVLVYALCLGAEIHYTSLNRSEPTWVRPMEIGFCVMFGVDLLIRFCLEGRLFFMGSRRWWNLLDTLSLTMLIVALLEGSRTLGNLSAFVRVGRILRLARCLWTFKNALAKWTHLRQLRVLITSMTESIKIMIWLVLLVLSFNYVYGLVLTESIWTSCPNVHTPVLCEKFGSLLSTMMTLYQIQYSGLLWGTLWDEVAALDWYFPAAFLSYIVFALMILVNTITSFICSLQGTVSKRERDLLIDNEMEYNERLVRQLYTIFQDFDQNGNGAISWAEFQLALEDERMHAFLAALELDMSDAVKVFQILASDKTGAIEESDFLLGCLRLRGGATAVDMVRIQMEQEWIHSALLQMKGLMQKNAKDLAAVQFTLAAQESVRPTSHFSRQKTSVVADGARDGDDTASDSSVEVLHHYQRTNLKTFERAVTVEELSGILDELPQVCHGWKDAHTGDVISEKKLNLYQFNYHYIMPKTAPQEGVLLQWPASCAKGLKALPKAGQEVCQRCSGMALPKARATVLRAQLEVEDDVEKLNVWVCLLRGHFVNMSSEVLFDEEDELPASDMSVIARNSISYKELLSSEACLPVWYCTHWWGEPLHSFILCCQEHAILRRLGSSASYWVCGYANRQHELDLEIAEDVIQTSFFAALRASRGLLLILDENATPFSRIWCDYELYSAVMNPSMELDIAATIQGEQQEEARILSKNMIPGESAVAKSAREQDFPIFLLDRGLQVCLEKGSATRESDKISILQSIAQSRELLSDEGKERLEKNLLRANQALHSTLAVLAWPQAMHKNLLPKHSKGLHSGMLNVCDALVNDSFRQSLDLSLAHFEETCVDSVVKTLAESLPSSLVKLKLSFEDCVRLTDLSLQALTSRFQQLKLQQLYLDFVGCKNLTDAGLILLAKVLHSSSIFELELHFAGCVRLHSTGILALQEKLPTSLRSFKASFKGTSINRNFRDLIDFKEYKVPRQ